MNKKAFRLAIASGKGGTGKTMLATNLAAMFAAEKDVLLVDLDTEEPNDALFLPIQPQQELQQFKMIPEWIEENCTLCGICTEVCNFNAIARLADYIVVFEELCHSCYACSGLCPEEALPMKPRPMGITNIGTSEKLQFVESRLNVGEEMPVPMIVKTVKSIDALDNPPQFQIFDCPPGTSCPVINAVQTADFVLLLTEPTAFGFYDLKLAVETMQSLGKEIGVVINRDGIGDDKLRNWCLESEIPIIASIPYDKEIAFNYARGKLSWDTNENLKQALDAVKHFVNEKMKAHA